MASSKEYLDFILEQLSELEEITYRTMMGEYIIYYQGKLVGGIYDDRLLVKPVKSAVALMPNATFESPYEGAKEMLLVDNVDSKNFLTRLFNNMYDELPTPKKKINELQLAGVNMKEKITLCGDNCIECPRYNAHTDEELKAVAELWYRVGWRNTIVSNEEIACTGCSSHKQCTYNLVVCTKEHSVIKCNQCTKFPCEKIDDMLKRSAEYKTKCKEVCTEQEYNVLSKAFFDKERNLKK